MHALYVIGPHGSAATAALHHIPKLMDTCTSNSNDPQQQRPGSVGSSSENDGNKPADGNNKPKDDNNQRKDDNNQRKDDHNLVLMLASSETASRTTNTSHPKSDKCSDLKSYKRLHIVPSFEQLIIPFLRMTVNIPFSPNSDFYELYGIDKSSKLHTKFDFKDAYTLSYHIDQEYEMLFDDAIHSQMDWSTLYRDFGTNTWSNDLIITIFQMASDSLEKYDVYPTRIALLRTTSERTDLIKKLKKSTYNILVPIKEFNNETELLVCTQIQRFHCKPSNIEFWNKDESSFKLAYVLWINFTHGKPFTSPYCELNNSIVVYRTDKLLEVGKQCKQASADDVWGYVIFLTVSDAAKEIWNPITVNKWCDFLYDALPNNESIEKFSAFLSKHNLVETFKSVLENTSPGKLRNNEQYVVIKKREAYKIQTILSKACQPINFRDTISYRASTITRHLRILESVGVGVGVDPSKISTSNTPFAMIDEHSALPQEQEILFTMHTVFRVGEIKQTTENSRLWEVQLTITDESDPQLSALTNCIKEEIDGTRWHRMGKLMLKVGHFDQAEELYNELLENSSNDTDRAHIYHQLGILKNDQGQYQAAVTFYEKSLEIKRKALPEDDVSLADTYGNIGIVYKNMGEYSKALEYYEKSLKIKEISLPPTHPDLAASYGNI
ncbi:unnamed protein product, partial [Rotaria socialis]